jgi:hypothetical protein
VSPSAMSARDRTDVRWSPVRRWGLVGLLVLGVAGCATAPERRPPVAAGVPAGDVGALVRRWDAEWRQFPGLQAAVDVVVSRAGKTQRTAGALLLSPTHLRLEAITPLGFPALILTAGPERVLVLNTMERRAWSARPTVDAMGRWFGVPVEPGILIRLLAGHVPLPPEGVPVQLAEDRGPHLAFTHAGVTQRVWVTAEGLPLRVEIEEGRQRVLATFARAVTGLLVGVNIAVPARAIEAEVRYLSGETRALPPEAFALSLPADVPIEQVD